MKDKSQYEEVCFKIISSAGAAKSYFLEAIQAAKDGEEYKQIFEDGNQAFTKAAKEHAIALKLEADENLDFGLLLIHAETILSSAETIRDLGETIIELIIKN